MGEHVLEHSDLSKINSLSCLSLRKREMILWESVKNRVEVLLFVWGIGVTKWNGVGEVLLFKKGSSLT